MYGAWAQAVLYDGAETTIRIKARDLVNKPHLAWATSRDAANGKPAPADMLTPTAIRITLAWLSPLGGAGRQVYTWRTQDITKIHPLTWRFERLELDPGDGNGDKRAFSRPPS